VANRTTYTQARAHLASLCDEVAETRQPYIIERRNGENVALISERELESLLETAHLLRSPKNARRLLTALERALEGSSSLRSTVGDLRRELGLEAESHAKKATR
jgi:antitoxin YefM